MAKKASSKGTNSTDKKKQVKSVSKSKGAEKTSEVSNDSRKKKPIWAIVILILFLIFLIWLITSSIRYHSTIGTEPPKLYCEVGDQTVSMNITGEWLSPSSIDGIKQVKETNVENPISVKPGETIHCYFDKKLEQNIFPISRLEDGVPDHGENVAIGYYTENGFKRDFIKATHHGSRMEFDFTIPDTLDANYNRIDFSMVFKAYDYWFTFFGSDVGLLRSIFVLPVGWNISYYANFNVIS